MDKIELKILREEIDVIDDQLCELFGKRLDMSKQVAIIKGATGDSIYKPEREKEIIERITKKAPDDRKELYKELFIEIMRVSREYQAQLLK